MRYAYVEKGEGRGEELAMTFMALFLPPPYQKGGHPAALVSHPTPPSPPLLCQHSNVAQSTLVGCRGKILVGGIITASVIARLRGKRRATPAICSSRHSLSPRHHHRIPLGAHPNPEGGGQQTVHRLLYTEP